MTKKYFLILILFFMASLLYGQDVYQDKLIKRDGTVIVCKIREIGDDEIKYNEEGLPSDVLIGIDKNKVSKIQFADGREMVINDSMTNSEDYKSQRKNAVKFNFFLPVSGGYALSYERSLKPGRSLEGELGLIHSTGSGTSMKAEGEFLKVGFKLIKSPDFYLKGMRYAHILKGGYIKPEIALTTFNYDKSGTVFSSTQEKGTATAAAFLLNAGKQVIYNNRFAVDWFIGAGYIIGGKEDINLRYFAFTGGTESSFVMSAGVRIGLLF